MVSYVTEAIPQHGRCLKKAVSPAVLIPISHTSPAASPVHTGSSLLWGLWVQDPHCTKSRSTGVRGTQSGLMWEGQGGCGGLFLGAFLGFQTALWFSELLLHCLSQPRSKQGIEEEESFDRGEAMMGLVTNVCGLPWSRSRPHRPAVLTSGIPWSRSCRLHRHS